MPILTISTPDDFANLNSLQWPLDKRPPYYYNQSERFADILHMLLRMRSLPPKTNVRPDGTLKAADGSDENAMRWFDMIQISRKPFKFVLSSEQFMILIYSSLLPRRACPRSLRPYRLTLFRPPSLR